MQIPLQITIRHIPRSDALEARIRERATKLEEFYRNIIACRVVVEQQRRHKHQGRQFNVRLAVHVPDHEIVVDRDHDEDVYVALRDAFDAVTRQLEDIARLQRHDVKTHETPLHGKVVRLFADARYGFIQTPDGAEYYFGHENVVDPSFEQLREGTEVQFIVEPAAEGLQANRISVGKHHHVLP